MKIVELASFILSLVSLVVGAVGKLFCISILNSPPRTWAFLAGLFILFAIYANMKVKK
ncbi:hypothetical protein KAI78_08415 [bacterium]|nr:hypothetical protein [bacterium]